MDGQAGVMNYPYNVTQDKGLTGELIAVRLWPELKVTVNGSREDKQGIDAYFGTLPVQIKYDNRTADSANIYHEIWEKSINRPEQKWRHSPSNAGAYIFVTEGFALMVEINELAIAERNVPLRQISSTSMGFLIPICNLEHYERKEI